MSHLRVAARPYVVVANPGLTDEFVVSEHTTHLAACRASDAARADGGLEVDVMKRAPDGSLTTEF